MGLAGLTDSPCALLSLKCVKVYEPSNTILSARADKNMMEVKSKLAVKNGTININIAVD